ncbi:HNH endonuclease [Sphingopyxis flava]|uniref:AP2 domain-containing protein n=1 Tax=Sphingopyxis flava TaxID=1507287 RepID=A0A1T5CSK7_9SPHN|nr:HNH endonuclease [Sphingopyxis flava]SKB62462.1 AP2 domain-containing protein [Sphingopyxis flava]
MSEIEKVAVSNNALSFEQADTLLRYDPETGLFHWKVSRGGTARAGALAGSDHGDGYWAIKVCGRMYKAHRLAHLLMTGKWPPSEIDHKNRNRSDNRWSNLRPCSRSDNMFNQGLSSLNTSGYRGVSLHHGTGKWRAQIKHRGRKIHLGVFETPESAAAVYAAAANDLFPTFSQD